MVVCVCVCVHGEGKSAPWVWGEGRGGGGRQEKYCIIVGKTDLSSWGMEWDIKSFLVQVQTPTLVVIIIITIAGRGGK